jgi:hypothetical protein
MKEKRYASWIIIRTALLAVMSFIIGILLKAIFDKNYLSKKNINIYSNCR